MPNIQQERSNNLNMNDSIKKLLKQAFSFFLISGVGWILDFTTYYILTKFLNFDVAISNMISAIPAITYVFCMSSKNIFKNKKSQLKMIYKYCIYFIYQILLVSLVSLFAETIYIKLIDLISIKFIYDNFKIVVKIFVTPITMILNFIIMKNLIEKL